MTHECPTCLENVPLVDDSCHCPVCHHEWDPSDDEPPADYFEQGDGCREGASEQTERLMRMKGERGNW